MGGSAKLDLVKVEILIPDIQLDSVICANIVKETNIEMTEKLKAAGVFPFWYSWHPRKMAGISYTQFVAYGVPDAKEASNLLWNNRAARIRIGLKP